MTRILVAGIVMVGGLLAIALPASAEDGGQYRRGGNGIVLQQDTSDFQR